MLRNESDDSWILPSEYQRVEWIESPANKANYINTGLILTSDDELTAIYQQNPAITPYDFLVVCGSYDRHAATYLTYRIAKHAGSWGGQARVVIEEPWDGLVHTAVLSKKGYTFDGVFHPFSNTSVRPASIPFYLFTWNYFGTNDYASRGLRFLRFFVKRNGSLIMDLVPCYRKEDDETGMYDGIGNTFFTNGVEGSFIKGADVN